MMEAPKVDSNITINLEISTLKQNITEYILKVKALNEEINACSDHSQLLQLNNSGRMKISSLNLFLDRLVTIAKENRNASLLKEIVLLREQLSTTMDSFKKANIRAMLTIQKDSRNELLRGSSESTGLRSRANRDKDHLAKTSSNITGQLLSISRQLADTTKRSADTLDSLLSSSESVEYTQEELKVTGSTISQSGKLLEKYGKREFTDKIVMFLAFSFFMVCVFYVIHRRLLYF